MMIEWAPGFTISDTPIRKVIGRSASVTNGWHRTNKHPIGFCPGESPGELAFLMLAEMDPGITVIRAQPTRVAFLHEDRLAHHIPDFAVLERGESILYEAKSRRQYDRPEVRLRLVSAAAAVEAKSWPYYVVLQQDILEDPRYENIHAVWRRFRPNFVDVQRLAVQSTLFKGERRISDVLADLCANGCDLTLETVLSLAANGCIFIDFDNPIGVGSLIRYADPTALSAPLLPRRRPADDLHETAA